VKTLKAMVARTKEVGREKERERKEGKKVYFVDSKQLPFLRAGE
jgi:hypothetical protein